MSKPIRYDSLLVRDLADELNGHLAGRPLFAVRMDREARVLELESDKATWRWALHPSHGELARAPKQRLDGNVILPRRARIESVVSLPDERILEFHVTGENGGAHGGVARRLVVELLTNQWNAVALAEGERITHVLQPRATAARTLQTGEHYVVPQPTGRLGADTPITAETWQEVIGSAEPGQRQRAFVARVAWASPLNAPFVIGEADTRDDALGAAYDRYLGLVQGSRTPCLLAPPLAGQPYGVRLQPNATSFASLLAAIEARGDATITTAPDARETAAAHAELQAVRSARKAKRLRTQLENAPREAAALRRTADLLLAQVHRVEKGAANVTLDDFEGGTLDVVLDTTLSPVDNATAYYTQARKRERAAGRLPELIERAEREAARWRALHARVESGAASAAEIAAAQPVPAQGSRQAQRVVTLPYRVYRTSGGLEVRVGRNPKANDALTLRHSSGNDIWLHAREVGGAHVILRWTDREANPPARDIEEAAVLAALHSKARTSKLVPVDYTRRKYVRKPRKSPPGRVVFERGKTVFVEPDAALEEELRVREDGE